MELKTKESLKHIYRYISNILVTTCIGLVFWHGWMTQLNELLYQRFLNKGNIMMLLVYLFIMVLLIAILGGYKIGVSRRFHMVLAQTVGLFCGNVVSAVITILIAGRVKHISKIVRVHSGMFVMQAVILFVVTVVLATLYRYIFPPYRLLHIYGDYENNLSEKINSRKDKYRIDAEMSCHESIEAIIENIKKYDAVLVNDVPNQIRNKILKECFDQSKRVYFTPKISDIIVKNSEELKLFDTPIYFSRNLGASKMYRFIKRFMDIIISLVGIVITSPIMIITAIAVYSYDRGNVFYRQKRCTIGNKVFDILKFRSMVMNAEADGTARLAEENDSRITPVGKVIRRLRIDELPQFINVLKGDMSIVGPRPERPELHEEYCKEIPEFSYRLQVKAGLTGYAQVYGKYNTSVYDKLKLDMIYVENCSVWMDVQLILQTLKVLFQKEATEGLKTEATDNGGIYNEEKETGNN